MTDLLNLLLNLFTSLSVVPKPLQLVSRPLDLVPSSATSCPTYPTGSKTSSSSCCRRSAGLKVLLCFRRLVHSDGSLFDLSVGGAPQLLQEEEKRGGQREEADEKWMKEEEEEEFPCMFERETLSDHITGKHHHHHQVEKVRDHKIPCSLLSSGLLEVGGGPSLGFVPAPPPLPAATSAPPLVAP